MRKAKPRKRTILPDPKFNDIRVTKFVNNMMRSGKKSIAFDIFFEAVRILVAQKTGEDGLEVWQKALANVLLLLKYVVVVLVEPLSRFLLKSDQLEKWHWV
jgi:small subunit ribosomal protein S7